MRMKQDTLYDVSGTPFQIMKRSWTYQVLRDGNVVAERSAKKAALAWISRQNDRGLSGRTEEDWYREQADREWQHWKDTVLSSWAYDAVFDNIDDEAGEVYLADALEQFMAIPVGEVDVEELIGEREARRLIRQAAGQAAPKDARLIED